MMGSKSDWRASIVGNIVELLDLPAPWEVVGGAASLGNPVDSFHHQPSRFGVGPAAAVGPSFSDRRSRHTGAINKAGRLGRQRRNRKGPRREERAGRSGRYGAPGRDGGPAWHRPRRDGQHPPTSTPTRATSRCNGRRHRHRI